MTKKVCCSLILGGIVYIFTMMLCAVFLPYPELMSQAVLYYSVIMSMVAFAAYGMGEKTKGRGVRYSALLALGVFGITMVLNLFSPIFLDIFSRIAVYYAIVAFIVALIGYVIGERSS